MLFLIIETLFLVTQILSHSVIRYNIFNYYYCSINGEKENVLTDITHLSFVSDMDIIFGLGQISIVGDIMLEAFIA